jgi:hypothetical protein
MTVSGWACGRRYETEGSAGGGFVSEGMPPSYDYFSAGMRDGSEGLEEIAGPALDSEEADGESGRRAQVRGLGRCVFEGEYRGGKV